jgi:hypothetical protein
VALALVGSIMLPRQLTITALIVSLRRLFACRPVTYDKAIYLRHEMSCELPTTFPSRWQYYPEEFSQNVNSSSSGRAIHLQLPVTTLLSLNAEKCITRCAFSGLHWMLGVERDGHRIAQRISKAQTSQHISRPKIARGNSGTKSCVVI